MTVYSPTFFLKLLEIDQIAIENLLFSLSINKNKDTLDQ